MNPSAAEKGNPRHLSPSSVATEVLRYRSGEVTREVSDHVAAEEPLEIRVNGQPVAVTMRTPGHDIELAAGFLLSEGLLRSGCGIASIKHCASASEGNVVDVLLEAHAPVDLSRLTRHVFASSSCGLCGKATIDSVQQQFARIESGFCVAAALLSSLPERMSRAQDAFALTGGLHAAAIFNRAGELVVSREDVGRHNAVDKALGYGVLRDQDYRDHILLVSGRASFEIMQKALAGRLPVVCAISAPSSLAVAFARENSQALVGFLREGGMNVYSGAERVTRD